MAFVCEAGAVAKESELLHNLASPEQDVHVEAALELARRFHNGTLSAQTHHRIWDILDQRHRPAGERRAAAMYFGEIVNALTDDEWHHLIWLFEVEEDRTVRPFLQHDLFEIKHALHTPRGQSRLRELQKSCAFRLATVGG